MPSLSIPYGTAVLRAFIPSMYVHSLLYHHRYYTEIEHPMDFSTMGKKLTEGKYQTMEDFRKDVELIFKNCRKFNPVSTFPTQCADNVEALFKKEWAKAMEKKMAHNEKAALKKMLNTLISEPLFVTLLHLGLDRAP